MTVSSLAHHWLSVTVLAGVAGIAALTCARAALVRAPEAGDGIRGHEAVTSAVTGLATALAAGWYAAWLAAREPVLSGDALAVGSAAYLAVAALVAAGVGRLARRHGRAWGQGLLLVAAGVLVGTTVGWLWRWTRPAYEAARWGTPAVVVTATAPPGRRCVGASASSVALQPTGAG